MSNFIPPKPGDKIQYICTNCKTRFSQKIPKPFLGMIKRKPKCPECGALVVVDPSIRY